MSPTTAHDADLGSTTTADEIGVVADAVIRAHREMLDAIERLRPLGDDHAELLQRALAANEAVVELEADLVASAATQQILLADSPRELGETLDGVATTWRARAQELVVQARLGTMDFDDAVVAALGEFEQAGVHLSELITSLRDEDAEWSAGLRDRARVVLHDVRAAVSTLLAAVNR